VKNIIFGKGWNEELSFQLPCVWRVKGKFVAFPGEMRRVKGFAKEGFWSG